MFTKQCFTVWGSCKSDRQMGTPEWKAQPGVAHGLAGARESIPPPQKENDSAASPARLPGWLLSESGDRAYTTTALCFGEKEQVSWEEGDDGQGEQMQEVEWCPLQSHVHSEPQNVTFRKQCHYTCNQGEA